MFRIITEGAAYRENVFLKNGQGIYFKSASQEDINLLESFMKRLSQESLRMRFMASISEVPQKIIQVLCESDFKNTVSILALTGDDGEQKIIGIGNYSAIGNGHSAEVSFLVEDAYQGKGIGTLLVERLAGIAAANGIVELEAEVLPENQPMINVFNSSGFEKHKVWNSDTVHIELPLNGAASLWEITDLRERIAVANSLIPLLRPKVVAVIGASRDSKSIGNIVFKNIINADFNGTVYPVNFNAASIYGIKTFSSVKDLPEAIDLAVIAVPAENVQIVAEEAIHAGAKGIVVVSAGFADAGESGKERQKKLVDLTRINGVRLLGPSCLGLMNTDPEVRLNASLAPIIMSPGKAGFFSHSAALGLVILEYAKERGIEFTTFVSAGNRADVSGNDLLEYWEEDSNTKMAILYLETFGNPRRFVRITRRMTYKKPILCVKSARSAAGKRAAESKSGGNTGGELEVEALFMQTGIILTPNLEDLFDIALILANQPLPRGNRVSIIANSTGMATLFADACEMNNLCVGDEGVIDLGAFTSADAYEIAVTESLINNNIDSLLIGFACVGNCDTEAVTDAIKRGVKSAEHTTGIEKPVLLCLMGVAGVVSLFEDIANKNGLRKFPAFRFPELAVNALAKIVRYVEFKKQPLGKLVWYDDVYANEARNLVKGIISDNTSPNNIIEIQNIMSAQLLRFFGIHIDEIFTEDSGNIFLIIKADPLFGPIIKFNYPGYRDIVRITPLTDRDIEETLQDFPKDIRNLISELLGRISQMIEEIPWLWELELRIVSLSEILKISGIKMNLNLGGAKRPSF